MTTPAVSVPLAGGVADPASAPRVTGGEAFPAPQPVAGQAAHRRSAADAAREILDRLAAAARRAATPLGITTALLFAYLYARPAYLLARDWWTNPEAGHGLLLAPLAIWFAVKIGVAPDARPNRALGLALLALGIVLRYVADLAAELFIMRGSMLLALAGLTAWFYGGRQLLRWWLPFTLVALSVPLPELVLSRLAGPLQIKASQIGAALLAWRQIPVLLSGNIIRLPGHELFVAEACSGLRSLTALISLGVLLGATLLHHWASRIVLLATIIPVAIVLNGIRVFLTGFLVFFVDPQLGEGFMHVTEGLVIFLVAFAILGALALGLERVERRVARGEADRAFAAPEPARG